MTTTAFLPAFLAMLVWALRSPRHWVVVTGVACYFQGATPFLLAGGGRLVGIAPAYLLLLVGGVHALRLRLQISRLVQPARPPGPPSRSLGWLLAFTLVGTVGAFLLPRVFDGLAHAMPTRGSIDAGLFYLVEPSSTNLFQALYLVFNLALVLLVASFMAGGKAALADVFKGICIGAGLSASLGVYQLAAFHLGLPWPADVVNSNTGVGQFPGQMAGALKRISATFWEPSLLSYHFVGTIGMLLLGGRARLLGWLVLVVQLLSTSSVGYIALGVLLLTWLLLEHSGPRRKLHVMALCLAVLALCLLLDFYLTGGKVTNEMVLGKASSSSGVNRSHANVLAVRTFVESWGFGVGVGSARASSFLATLLATTGWLGMATFLMFVVGLLRTCFGSTDPAARALGFGICGFLAVWAISIPDIVQALFWYCAGAAVGLQLTGMAGAGGVCPAPAQITHPPARATRSPRYAKSS